MTETIVDRVLTAPLPSFSEEEAAVLARELFGIDGVAKAVASERDQAFLIDGERPAVLKLSNAAEDPAQLDFEALAAQRVAQVDPAIPVALPLLVPGTSQTPKIRWRTAHPSNEATRLTTPECTTGCRVTPAWWART